jgi:hypothetical protein
MRRPSDRGAFAMRRLGFTGLMGIVLLSSSGCAMMHELQPHRLWRWNRNPAPSSDPYFSVSDPIPQLGTPAESLDESSDLPPAASSPWAAEGD